MDIETRIEQFRKLVDEDPSNDIAWFSLGGVLNQSGRSGEAGDAFVRCTQANADMSKAYQLAGEAFMAADRRDDAIVVLSEGYKIAGERGDLMPKKAMGELLARLGRPPADAVKTAEPVVGDMKCHATGRAGTKMARVPFRGAVGAWIRENITKQTFDEWIGLGTKIINELRLDLSLDEHEAVYDHAMRRYIKLDDATYAGLTGSEPPRPAGPFAEAVEMILERIEQIESFGGDLHRSVGG